MNAPPRARNGLTVGVIGAGRVGTVLAAALAAAGHTVTAVTPTRTPERLTALLPGVPVRPAPEVVGAARDLLLLAVPDDSLAGLVNDLATQVSDWPAGQVVAHPSGAHGLAVLSPVSARGARPLALHPAMTFTGTPDDLARLPGTGYGVTAPDDVRAFATRLVADLRGHPEWLPESARPLYHAALAHGANHLTTLVNEAADWLRAAGIGRPERILAPLLRAALENTLRHGDAALTGPVARGDTGTVTGHLDVLTAVAPESVPAYRALAQRTTERAVAAGRLDPAAARSLQAVLDPPVTAAGRAA